MSRWLLALILCLSSGCVYKEKVVIGDPAFPQPWVGPGERARVDATYYSKGEMAPTVAYEAFWVAGDGRRWEVDDLVESLNQTLASWGCKQPEDVRSGSPPAETWRRPAEYDSDDREQYNVGLGRPTMTIVCLDPVVVLRTPGEVVVAASLYFSGSENLGPYSKIKPARCWRIWLPEGFTYGDTAMFSPDTRWFSPGLTDDLRDVQFISDTEAIIPVPWGRLRLSRQDDRWIVHAEKRE